MPLVLNRSRLRARTGFHLLLSLYDHLIYKTLQKQLHIITLLSLLLSVHKYEYLPLHVTSFAQEVREPEKDLINTIYHAMQYLKDIIVQ